MSEVAEQVIEVLRTFGSREKFGGVIDHYDLAGTTAFIRSDDNEIYLAFASEAPGKPGQIVTFRKDQLRARDIIRIEPETSHGA